MAQIIRLSNTDQTDTPELLPQQETTSIDAAGELLIEVPGGDLLLNAEYNRDGQDLVLEGEDGTKAISQNYFAMDPMPDLATVDGAVITPKIAMAWVGPLASGQYAQ